MQVEGAVHARAHRGATDAPQPDAPISLGRGRLGDRGFLEHELPVLHIHPHGVPLVELALEQPERERVLDQALERTLERPRPVVRIPTGFRQKVLRLLGNVEPNSARCETVANAHQL